MAKKEPVFSGGKVRHPRFETDINKHYTGTITIYGRNGEIAITTSFRATVSTVQVRAGVREPRIVEKNEIHQRLGPNLVLRWKKEVMPWLDMCLS